MDDQTHSIFREAPVQGDGADEPSHINLSDASNRLANRDQWPETTQDPPWLVDGSIKTSAAIYDTVRARAPAPKELPRREPGSEFPTEQDNSQPAETIEERDQPSGRVLLRRHPFAVAIGLMFFVTAVPAGCLYWDQAQRFQSTDDAFIAARQFPIAPKVSGYLAAVPVTDNQHVGAGDAIVHIDDRDFRVALAQAEAQVASAEANIENVDAQINVQQAQINANQAQVKQAQASLVFAQQQAARYQDLAKKGADTVQNEQQFVAQMHQQEAALESSQATLTLAQRQVGALNAQRSNAVASLEQAKAQRDQAQLNLSYTTVTAAQPGRVVNLTAAIGQFAQAGSGLAMFVPDEIWVTANFKETQLDAIRPGQPATLRIDAYPERSIGGHVDSVQAGSGPAFSLLPPENATGNYVKIVQRVPVKIVMDSPPRDVALGPGMSVVPEVRVDATLSLYERLKGWL